MAFGRQKSGIRSMETLFTKKEVAERYHVSIRTVDRWIVQYGIVSASPGSKFLFRESDLIEMEPARGMNEEEKDDLVADLLGE